VLGEQLQERDERLIMLQANESALKADLAAAHDTQISGGARLPVEAAGDAAGEGGANKAKKGWGDRVKEMKERADKAKAKIQKKP
jgi:hypothetical protein